MSHQEEATVQPRGCKLQDYAAQKALDLDFLKQLGLTEISYMGEPAVHIPYMDEDGDEIAVRFRLSLDRQSDRFRWRKGDAPVPYGLWRLSDARARGEVALTEGESDAQTLWSQGFDALGLPGCSSWQPDWAAYLDSFDVVYLVVEPDGGGEALLKTMATSPVAGRIRVIRMSEAKDPSELYASNPSSFRERWAEAMRRSEPMQAVLEAEAAKARNEAWCTCKQLARDPDILGRFAESLRESGVAGEERVGKLLFLAFTSRLLDRPISLAIKGPSSGGKSFLVEQVSRYFPDDAYYALSAMSEKALVYSDEPLSHRMLVIYEAAGVSGDFASYLIRSLLSEGRVRYETVEKTKQGMKPRVIEREGPTGLVVTTTATSLHPENETRLISVTVTDTPEQTRQIFRSLANPRPQKEVGAEWSAYQVWLTTADHDVAIPFAGELAELMPPDGVRLRRDFKALLTLIAAHALLHQATRGRDESGRIQASVEDYAIVRDLVADLMAAGVEAEVPSIVREAADAVSSLLDGSESSITQSAVAEKLGLDKSAAHRRVKAAIHLGYLKNLTTKKGQPAQLVLGDPLPEDRGLLPEPSKLHGCTVASTVEGAVPLPSTVREHARALASAELSRSREATACDGRLDALREAFPGLEEIA